MIILALNCGSSSVKYMLYDWAEKKVMAKGIVERIGLSEPVITQESDRGKFSKVDENIIGHKSAISEIVYLITSKQNGVISSMDQIKAIGHRIVHGGDYFTKSVKLNDELIEKIRELSPLAPLHNPANLDGITASKQVLAEAQHVAIFDTAFHQSIPEHVFRYAVPTEWYKDHMIRKYGFHGTSHLYISKRAAKLLGKPADETNLITMHIGNGVSVTAIKNGLSYDTSMGMTPLEGAIMGTRSGCVDPAIPLQMIIRLGLTAEEVDKALNKESGLLAITKRFSDRRDIEKNIDTDPLCKLAVEMECYSLKRYIGSYMAALGRVDAIVFTAGVGENSSLIRERTLEGLEELGIVIDKKINSETFSKSGETLISTADSKIKVFMIPTNEEIVFIEDVVGVSEGKDTDHMKYNYSFK